MRDLAQRDSRRPEIQAFANACESTAVATGQTLPFAIDTFLRSNWVIRPDPVEAEYIESPAFQLAQFEERGFFAGDCDDAATMAASLLHALAWPCSFVAYRLPGAPEFSHVNVRCSSGLGSELEIDPVTSIDQLPIRGAAETMEVSL